MRFSVHGARSAIPFDLADEGVDLIGDFLLTLAVRDPGGSPTTSHEIQGVGFVAKGEVPELSLTRIVPGQIARMFKHYRRPDLPADFD
jgi:hypothetical protein